MDKKYKSYKRIHRYQYESDVEKGKIKQNKRSLKKSRKKAKNILDNYVQEGFDEKLYDAYLDQTHQEHKHYQNHKEHKNRLKAIKDEID